MFCVVADVYIWFLSSSSFSFLPDGIFTMDVMLWNEPSQFMELPHTTQLIFTLHTIMGIQKRALMPPMFLRVSQDGGQDAEGLSGFQAANVLIISYPLSCLI